MTACPWLPALVTLEDSQGDWFRYAELVYSYFYADFVRSRPSYEGFRLRLKRHPVVQGKEWTFWHLIQDGPIEPDRTPNLRRCERIRWPRPIVEHCDDDGLMIWEETRERSEIRVHLWFETEDYVVVLARRGVGTSDEYMLLWTAYVVDTNHSRRNLRKRFERHRAQNS